MNGHGAALVTDEDDEPASQMYPSVLAPLQTAHAAPTDPACAPAPVPFEEAAFHEYECRVDWGYLAQAVAKRAREASAVGDAAALLPGSSKRGRSDSTDETGLQAKYAKLSHDRAATVAADAEDFDMLEPEPKVPHALASTSLLFRLSPQGDDNAHAASLLSTLASRSAPLSLASCYLEPTSTNEEAAGQLRILRLNLRSSEGGVHIAALPIVSLVDAPLERAAHTWTNGAWLVSAATLAQSGVVKMDIELSVRPPAANEQLQGASEGTVTLELRITLSLLPPAFASSPDVHQAEHLLHLLRFVSPSSEREAAIRACGKRASADFIYAHMRSSALPASASLQPPQLAPNLMPFQRRSVNFLLGREGVQLAQPDAAQQEWGRPRLKAVSQVQGAEGVEKMGLWWEQVGQTELFFNALSGRFSTSAEEAGENIRAAILAEEMGLGKTVEVLALILLNPAPLDIIENPQPYYDKRLELDILPAKTTLIVCPEILRQQWLDEAGTHAEDLAVYSFLTRKRAEQDKPKDKTWAEWAASFDVIVVSFDTLRTELHVAQPERARSRRFDRKYERPRSPLVQLRYHRVIMDEVQLVGHSGAADTVSMIERTSSIAVSGTPIKRGDLTDLQSLFRFLRVPFAPSGAQWQRLLGPSMAHSLARVLRVLATRHIKDDIKGEMVLPTQTRWLVPIELGPVQRAYYEDLWNAALRDLGLSERGEPTNDMYEPDIEKLRRHLLLLRRCCTHPQVAQAAAPAGGGGRGGQQTSIGRTIQDMKTVLERMIEGAASTRDSLFLSVRSKAINAATLLLQDKLDPSPTRLEEVRTLLEKEQAALEGKIEELRKALRAARTEGPAYRFSEEELEEMNDSDEESDFESDAGAATDAASKKLKERVKLRANHVTALKLRLRLFHEQLHRALHTLGSVFYQLGERDLQRAAEAQAAQKAAAGAERDSADAMAVDAPAPIADVPASAAESAPAPSGAAPPLTVSPYKAEEDAAYAAAEAIRRELLEERLTETESAAAAVRRLKEMDVEEAETFDVGGLQSHFEFSKLNDLSELLDQNAKVIEAWRTQILERILKPVNREVDQSNENDDQYAEALDDQVEAETLMEMYRVLLAERERILSGHTAVQATAKPRLFTALEQQVKAAKRAAIMGAQYEDVDPALVPDADQLQAATLQLSHFKRLDRERKEVSLPQKDDHSLLDIIARLRETAERAVRNEEVALAHQAAHQARGMLKKQKTSLEALNREQAVFSRLFNARSSYFMQMQIISDSVRDMVVNESIELDRENLQREVEQLLLKHGEAQSRVKWLAEIQKDESIECEICTGDFPIQCVMPCGHYLCEGCVKKLPKQLCHRCRKPIRVEGIPVQLIAVVPTRTRRSASPDKADQAAEGDEGEGKAPSPAHVRYIKPTYNLLSDEERRQLQTVPIEARYGSKLHLLTQHLVHIQKTELSSKTIVFSSFSNGLDLVSQALNVQGIPHVRVDGGGKAGGKAVSRFRDDDKDSGVNVLLLHSEAQSAGLNLLCATRIILLEPLVNHAAELQALGRIHRIGQTRETHVYCYSATNTVEERICNAQAARGQSLYLQGKASSADSGHSTTLTAPVKLDSEKETAAVRRQGERVNTIPELLACYFDAHTGEQAVFEPIPRNTQPQQAQQAEGSETAQRRALAAAAAELRRHEQLGTL